MPAFEEIHRPTPNVTPGVNECLGVIFHHAAMDFAAAIKHLTNPDSGVSYHLLINTNGDRCIFADDKAITHHAGVSSFHGRPGCNRFMLGVSFAGNTYENPLTAEQTASAIEWLSIRHSRYHWSLDDLTDHRQVAPDRKNDLNPVEWKRLIAAIRDDWARR